MYYYASLIAKVGYCVSIGMRVMLFSKDPTVWNKFISLKISSLFITFL